MRKELLWSLLPFDNYSFSVYNIWCISVVNKHKCSIARYAPVYSGVCQCGKLITPIHIIPVRDILPHIEVIILSHYRFAFTKRSAHNQDVVSRHITGRVCGEGFPSPLRGVRGVIPKKMFFSSTNFGSILALRTGSITLIFR